MTTVRGDRRNVGAGGRLMRALEAEITPGATRADGSVVEDGAATPSSHVGINLTMQTAAGVRFYKRLGYTVKSDAEHEL
jgi:hypothetical protein